MNFAGPICWPNVFLRRAESARGDVNLNYGLSLV